MNTTATRSTHRRSWRITAWLVLVFPSAVSSFGVASSLVTSLSSAFHHHNSHDVNRNSFNMLNDNLLFQQYRQQLHDAPLATQMTTGVVLAVVGDAVAQLTSHYTTSTTLQTTDDDDKQSQHQPQQPKFEYNLLRAVSFASFDGVYRAAQHVLYPPMIQLCQGHVLLGLVQAVQQLLFTTTTMSSSSTTTAASLEQALVSQLVIIPLIYYPSFFAVTGMVQGLTREQSWQRASTSFVPLMQRNLIFWIPVQFGVFQFCQSDPDLQIVFLTAFGLIWTVILSVLAGSATSPKAQRENTILTTTTSDDDDKVVVAAAAAATVSAAASTTTVSNNNNDNSNSINNKKRV